MGGNSRKSVGKVRENSRRKPWEKTGKDNSARKQCEERVREKNWKKQWLCEKKRERKNDRKKRPKK